MLKRGVTLEAARAATRVQATRLAEEYPDLRASENFQRLQAEYVLGKNAIGVNTDGD